MGKKPDNMSLQIVSRFEIAAAEWDAIVKGSPYGWVFSLYGWQEMILAVSQWGFEDFSFGLRENGKLLAVVPLQFNSRNGRMSSSAWGGSGPVLDGSLAEKKRQRILQMALDQCVAFGRKSNATHFDFSVSPVTRSAIASAWGVNPFVFCGLEDLSILSHVIDLAPDEDALWAGLSADARRQVRIAREQGYTVERARWDECVDHYYSLHCETYRRTGVNPHPRDYFAGIAAHIAPAGHSVLWRVRSSEGETIAYHNAAWFGVGGYYHTGCSAVKASELGASYLLFWEAMLGAKKAGIRWYDCGAIFPNSEDAKQQGLTTFKTKFGGEAHRLFRVEILLQKAAGIAIPSSSLPSPPSPTFASRIKHALREGIKRLMAWRKSMGISRS